MIDVRPIIGINAEKQVGKDTVASMLCYIFNTGVLRCSFREWTIKYDNQKNKSKLKQVIHFADYPKDILSKTFGIDRELFDDIVYKEHKLYLIDQRQFVDMKNKVLSKYIIANHAILATSPLGSFIKAYNGRVAITLRVLMQYFGTQIGRGMLHDDCWIRATMTDAFNNRSKYGYSIIADVRFANESDAIRSQSDGYVIKLTRNIERTKDEHESEQLDGVKYDVLIENNGSKIELFYKVVELVGKIINRNVISASSTGEQPK